jgi:hypothetical protein
MRPITGNPKLHRTRAIMLCGAVASLALTSCAQQQQMAALRPPPYFALGSGAQLASNAHRIGYFAEEHGCVVFRPADSSPAMTPVFPKDETALVTDGANWLGFYVKGTPVAMGQMYRLRGDPGSVDENVALARPIPVGCPSSYFVVGSAQKALADVSLFCDAVIICRSYGID